MAVVFSAITLFVGTILVIKVAKTYSSYQAEINRKISDARAPILGRQEEQPILNPANLPDNRPQIEDVSENPSEASVKHCSEGGIESSETHFSSSSSSDPDTSTIQQLYHIISDIIVEGAAIAVLPSRVYEVVYEKFTLAEFEEARKEWFQDRTRLELLDLIEAYAPKNNSWDKAAFVAHQFLVVNVMRDVIGICIKYKKDIEQVIVCANYIAENNLEMAIEAFHEMQTSNNSQMLKAYDVIFEKILLLHHGEQKAKLLEKLTNP